MGTISVQKSGRPPRTSPSEMSNAERPLDGIVLTEHRQFDGESDYRALEDKYGLLILKASEVETDYVAATGVDYIAVGELTHSAPVLDLGLDLEAVID